MIVLDANVLIASLNRFDAHHERAHAIVASSDDLAAHRLSIAEALVAPARTGRLAAAWSAIRATTTMVGGDDEEPARLALLRARTGLRMPDCCPLDAAMRSRGHLATFDAALARTAAALDVPIVTA